MRGVSFLLSLAAVAVILLIPSSSPAVAAEEPAGVGFSGSINGVIVDATTGAPISQASVNSHWERKEGDPTRTLSAWTTTDESGRFTLEGIPPDRDVWIRVDASEYIPWHEEEGIRAGDHDLRIAMQKGAMIRGRLEAEGGRSASYGAVYYSPVTEEGPAPERFVSVGESGEFLIHMLEAGTYILSARWGPFVTTEETRVPVGPGEVVSDIRLDLVPGGTIRVTVRREETGEPVGGLMVRGKDEETGRGSAYRVGPDGVAVCEGLFPGEYSFSIGSMMRDTGMLYGGEPVKVRVGLGETKDAEVTVRGADTMRGTVVNASGERIAGATVSVHTWYLYQKTNGAYRNVEGRSDMTGPDGDFAVSGLPPTSGYPLTVWAEGYAPTKTEEFPPDADEIRIVLERGVVVSGTVRDPTGNPVQAAKVIAHREDGPRGRPRPYGLPGGNSAGTGPDGTYRISEIPAGEYRIVASKGVLSAPAQDNVKLEPGDEAKVDFVLTAGFTVSGRVVEMGTDQGVGGAKVSLRSSDSNPSVLSAADGTFAFENVQAGEYEPNVWPGSEIERVYTPSGTTRPKVTVSGNDVTHIRLEMPRYGEITGRVLDPTGEPVANAQIRYSGYGDSRAVTVEDGTFHLECVNPGENIQISVMAEGYPGIRSRSFELKSGGTLEDLEIVLPEMGSVRGSTRDSDGEPVAGAKVKWRPIEQTDQEWPVYLSGFPHEVNTTTDGSYLIEYLLPGKYEISASTEFAHQHFPGGKRVEYVEAAKTIEGVDFIIDLPALDLTSIDGIVVNEEGMPIPDCHITRIGAKRPALHHGTITKEDGRFHYEQIFTGTHTLKVEPPPPYARVAGIVVTAPTDEIRIVLNRDDGKTEPMTVSGKVLDRETGEPLPLVRVILTTEDTFFDPDRANPRELRAEARTDDDGAFEITDIPMKRPSYGRDVRYLHIEQPGYVSLRTYLHLEDEQPKDGLEYRLERAGVVTGRVLDYESGDPLGDIYVNLSESRKAHSMRIPQYYRGPGSPHAETDAEGRFVLQNVPPGPAQLRVQEKAHAAEPSREISITAGATTEVEFRLHPGGTVAGKVVDHEGKPIPQVDVYLTSHPHDRLSLDIIWNQQSKTGEDGRYMIERVYPGTYLAHLPTLDGLGAWKKVEVEDREREEVDFAVPTASVRGVVTDNGSPVGGCRVYAVDGVGAFLGSSLSADSDGAFRFDLLPAGPVRLQLQADEQRPRINREMQLDLEPGEERNVSLELPSGSISGTVVSATDGSPVSHATLMLLSKERVGDRMRYGRNPDARTDESGEFRLDHVPPGDYTIEILSGHSPFNFFLVHIEEGMKVENLRLPVGEGGSIEGTVNPPPGKGMEDMVGGLQVLIGTGPDAFPSYYGMGAFATGEFRIPTISPGTYTIMAGGEDGPVMVSENVQVESGETTRVELNWPANPVRLMVIPEDETGTPVGTCEAYLTTPRGTPIFGSRELGGLAYYGTCQVTVARDRYRLHVEKPGYKTLDVPLDLREVPETHRVAVKLESE